MEAAVEGEPGEERGRDPVGTIAADPAGEAGEAAERAFLLAGSRDTSRYGRGISAGQEDRRARRRDRRSRPHPRPGSGEATMPAAAKVLKSRFARPTAVGTPFTITNHGDPGRQEPSS